MSLPAEEVPAELPEPALGINFARNGMQRKDWLALVAVHSDTWLMAVAFYNAARLNREGRYIWGRASRNWSPLGVDIRDGRRDQLFELINELPTCFEVVTGKAKDVRGKKRSVPAAGRTNGVNKQFKPVRIFSLLSAGLVRTTQLTLLALRRTREAGRRRPPSLAGARTSAARRRKKRISSRTTMMDTRTARATHAPTVVGCTGGALCQEFGY